MGHKNRIVNPSPARKQKADWTKLWQLAKATFKSAEMDRQHAILENFKDQKEEICRVLNIVSEADLARIQRQIEQTDGMKGK